MLEYARAFSDDAASLAGTVKNNTLQQTSGCSILFCLLFQRVGCFCETLLNSTSSSCCDITVFISILQLHKLNNLIHSKSVFIVLYDNAETPHRHDRTLSFNGGKVSWPCQKKGLFLSTDRCLNLFLVIPIYTCTSWCSLNYKVLGTFWKNPSHHEFNREHTTVCFISILLCLVKSASTASTTKLLLGIASFNSIYIHILLLKNMEGSQRSQFKDNFQVNVG